MMLLGADNDELLTEHIVHSVVKMLYTCWTGLYVMFLQLLGYYIEAVWQTGLLTAAIQKAGQQAELLAKYSSARDEAIGNSTAKWIVLDGELNPEWIDGVNCFLTPPYSYCALNSEITVLHG